MELRQLVYAEAVARHRHFTRAAEELHVAQSALSHQIRRLEAELGTELFERTSRRVVADRGGRGRRRHARRRVLAEVDGVRGEVDELRGLVRGRVSIGALLPAGEVEVTTLLASFNQAFPAIEVGLREGTAADMRSCSRPTELDVAFSLIAGDPPAEPRGRAAQRGGGRRRLPARRPRPTQAQVSAADLGRAAARDPALGLGDQARRSTSSSPRAGQRVQRLARERRSVPDPLPGLRRVRRRDPARVDHPPRRARRSNPRR